MAPHVLFLSERFAPDLGGVARSSARVAGTLARLGCQVDVLAWTRSQAPGAVAVSPTEPAPDQPERAQAGAVTAHRMGLFAHWDLSLQHTLNLLDWHHRRRPFDLVWGHYLYPAGFAAVLFAQLHGLPSVVSARGNDVDQMMFPPGDFARLTWTLQRADLVTAVSRDLAHKINVLLGVPEHAQPIPNAVDTELFRPTPEPDHELRAALGIGPDEAVLGFSGELRHKKGTPFLLSALTEVRRERPACLLVIGEVRAREEAQLMSYRAAAPDDAARIIVTGHLDDPAQVARHLRLCDLVLQPSMWEGMPNAVLEAMACARPVLASDAGGIPELIEHGRDGYLIPRAQLDHLGEATLELLALPAARRAELGAAARRRMETEFSPAHQLEVTRALLDRVLPGGW
ncbi:glycosyltransferase [Haliangium sp.]|uniref:glycosyltransferase n=1 Tax=Haliangium sp. TaxID=2663208 RepID=UPI003D09D635